MSQWATAMGIQYSSRPQPWQTNDQVSQNLIWLFIFATVRTLKNPSVPSKRSETQRSNSTNVLDLKCPTISQSWTSNVRLFHSPELQMSSCTTVLHLKCPTLPRSWTSNVQLYHSPEPLNVPLYHCPELQMFICTTALCLKPQMPNAWACHRLENLQYLSNVPWSSNVPGLQNLVPIVKYCMTTDNTEPENLPVCHMS